MIIIKNLIKKYSGFVMDIKYLSFNSYGFYTIEGKSGCGKSTFLNLLSGLEKEYEGIIKIDQINIKTLNEDELSNFRFQKIGFVHQKTLCIKNLSVYENLLLELKIKDIDYDYLNYLIKQTKIENILDCNVNVLSGGEKQKVTLIRTLVRKPNILLLDEPTANLDDINSKIICDLLKEYSKNHIVIFVTHNKKIIKEYSDTNIIFENGKVKEKKEINITKNCNKLIIKEKRENKLSFKFQLKYIFNIFKKKKIRNFLIFLICFFSVFSLLFIFLINDNINVSLKYYFSQFYQDNQIILENKNYNNFIYKKDSVQEYQIYNLLHNYKDQILNYGYIYETDFNNFFKDNNEFRINYKNKSRKISTYQSRHINEFISTDLIEDKSYIYKIEDLNNDEIIISLNNNLLNEICSTLSIKANFSTLYSYLKNNDIYLSLFVKNNDWYYEDEQLFKLVGFVIETDFTIYHSNEFFNEEVFEKNMKLPSTLYQETTEKPWYLKKTLIINLAKNGEVLFGHYYNDLNLNCFLFDKISSDDFIYNLDKASNKYKLYKNLNNFDFNVFSNLESYNFKNYYISNYGGYLSLGNNLVSGFVNTIYFIKKEDDKNEIIDLITSNSSQDLEIDNNKEIAIGGFNNFDKKTIKFSLLNTDNNLFNNELTISSALANKLDSKIGEYIYCLYKKDENIYEQIFNIKNIINDENYLIYGNNNWSYTFFLTNFFEPSINLQPYSISINIENKKNIKEMQTFLKDRFKDFNVYTPLLSINSEIDSILNIIKLILFIFSFLSMITSIFLLLLISKSLIQEYKNDILILYILGKRKNDCLKLYKKYNLFILLLVLFSNFIFSLFLHFFISKLISNILVINFIPSYSIFGIFFVVFLLILIYFFSTRNLNKEISKINLIENLKKI